MTMRTEQGWGRRCPECDRIVARWESLGGKLSLAVEVLEDGSCRDIHTLEAPSWVTTTYACEDCGTEVDNESWLKLECSRFERAVRQTTERRIG